MTRRRQFGTTGITTEPLALGGNVFGFTADRERSFAVLDAFVAEGFGTIDTADMYSNWVPGHSGGESETIIGDWLASRGGRDRVVIVTKVGKLGPLTAANIERSCEASLRRLRTDRIDLYLSHEDGRDVPLAETLEAHDRLVRAGKVRAAGASNYDAGRLDEAARIAATQGLDGYRVLQPEYNLLERRFERELQPACERLGLGVMAYFALASGFLSGKYRSKADTENRARGGAVGKYLDARGERVLAALDRIAAARGATPAQLAIAWIVANPAVTVAIASATSPDQLRDLVVGARLVLAPEEKRALDAAGDDAA